MLSGYQIHMLGVAGDSRNAASEAGQSGIYAFGTASLLNSFRWTNPGMAAALHNLFSTSSLIL
ncbi:hypothetical protein [Hymenobacter cellulosivorans]|uniref:Uncharacterized protein n=1 Tax=Hymenobacter cellulosivorans TaxID=2932249 RepID=A0ABY4F321_9BACT|nr:hypothetical protein [Hymenobacter cellulosivorans]UOQ50955.1 hypothetical protein MUN80_14430 [Hymenobacter cellulosivorans]